MAAALFFSFTSLSRCLLTFGNVQSTCSISNNTRYLEPNIEAPSFPARTLYPLTAQCYFVVEALKNMRYHTTKTQPYPYTAYNLLLNPSCVQSTFQRGGEVPSTCFWPQPHSVIFGAPNSIWYREILRRDAISPYQSP